MHIWPDASTKVSKTQKTLLDVFFIFRIYYDLKQIWFAEHTKIVVPKALPEDKFVLKAGRWNLKQICNALLKDMDASDYMFDQKFIDPYTEKEKVVLNMSEEGGIMFLEEGREDKYKELRMTIKSSWEQMQKMDCNNEEVVPKMQEIVNNLFKKIIKQETPRLDTSATAINPEPTPIVTETTSSAPIAPEAKVADESQEANHTAPETTSYASPKPSSEDPNVTVPEAKLGDTKPHLVFKRNFKKTKADRHNFVSNLKASESNVQKDDILAENKKAKDEYVAAKLHEGFFKGINSMNGNGKTSLEKITRESAKTIENLQEDGESKPSSAKIDEFALATSRNRNNIQVEASSGVTKEKETLSSELRGMNHPERFLNATHDKKRIFLILDLNGVLGSFGSRKIPKLRPHCHEFVRFCVASFKKVVFWSSMNRYSSRCLPYSNHISYLDNLIIGYVFLLFFLIPAV
ncbi:hypothetical protein MKW98_021262 [Papaver atlanticum]|uniref:FCP1 homology domain-containing protein n=1 Tax=Papaver atlanticum TaxID=357466 RepID=A0AAD4T8L7_9MAGN|nr:hypothetical protein MKW98_021262 [Papaver atlanticum]